MGILMLILAALATVSNCNIGQASPTNTSPEHCSSAVYDIMDCLSFLREDTNSDSSSCYEFNSVIATAFEAIKGIKGLTSEWNKTRAKDMSSACNVFSSFGARRANPPDYSSSKSIPSTNALAPPTKAPSPHSLTSPHKKAPSLHIEAPSPSTNAQVRTNSAAIGGKGGEPTSQVVLTPAAAPSNGGVYPTVVPLDAIFTCLAISLSLALV